MKVEENPEEPIYIRTVFGLGYKWEDGRGEGIVCRGISAVL